MTLFQFLVIINPLNKYPKTEIFKFYTHSYDDREDKTYTFFGCDPIYYTIGKLPADVVYGNVKGWRIDWESKQIEIWIDAIFRPQIKES